MCSQRKSRTTLAPSRSTPCTTVVGRNPISEVLGLRRGLAVPDLPARAKRLACGALADRRRTVRRCLRLAVFFSVPVCIASTTAGIAHLMPSATQPVEMGIRRLTLRSATDGNQRDQVMDCGRGRHRPEDESNSGVEKIKRAHPCGLQYPAQLIAQPGAKADESCRAGRALDRGRMQNFACPILDRKKNERSDGVPAPLYAFPD